MTFVNKKILNGINDISDIAFEYLDALKVSVDRNIDSVMIFIMLREGGKVLDYSAVRYSDRFAAKKLEEIKNKITRYALMVYEKDMGIYEKKRA